MRVVLFPLGSSGDVHPFVGLGSRLRERGHDVTVATNEVFESLVERAGLGFVELSSREEFEKTFNHPNIWHPRYGYLRAFTQVILPAMRRQFAIAERCDPDETILVGATGSIGARIAHDALGIPLVSVHLQPQVLWSEHRSPVVGPILVGDWVPRFLKRFQFRLAEALTVVPFVLKEANAFRVELGLPPHRDVRELWNSPQRVIGMFPEWFAPRQPDWPRQLALTGFPLWDEVGELPEEVEAFLGAGDPPVVFTAGTAMVHGASFFAESVEACRGIGRRGVLLSRCAEQVPDELPPEVRHFEFVPLQLLLPRSAALVHHGGIGTLGQALAAGLPQLVMPMTYDQPDNAARLQRLGVAEAIKPAAYRAPAVARALERLLSSREVESRCERLASRFAHGDPLGEACDAIEGVLERQTTAA